MLSGNIYHLTWISLTLDVGCLFSAAPAKRRCCSLPWMRNISSPPPLLTLNLQWLLGPPAPAQPPLLGCGVAPPGRCPWPWAWGCFSRPLPRPRTWGSSSRLFLCCRSLALSAAAPDLGHGVAPISHSCTVAAWHSRPLPLTSDLG